MQKKIVVTGLGAITPVGNNVSETWKNICAGVSGIDKITNFDATNFPVQIAAEVKNFKPNEHGLDRKQARKMSRATQFLTIACAEAISDSGYNAETFGKKKSGIVNGVGIGQFDAIEAGFKKYDDPNAGVNRIPPLSAPLMLSNEPAANVSLLYGINGPAWTLANACAAGTDAIGAALDLIRSGRVDVCIASGCEATVTGFSIGAFQALSALTSSFNDNPKVASRPFDKNRSGFVMGEGAVALILEEEQHALARGAKIYAEIAGYGSSSDAYHITAPRADGTTGALAITRAMEDAGVKPSDIQYYNAHGTSTQANDVTETKMVKLAFGDAAKSLHISSTKSMTGHMVGAAGTAEALFCILAIRDGFIPPTINLDEPDVENGCDLDYTPNVGVKCEVNVAASSSFGFGGHNGCIVIRRVR